jgi:iron(III) transport system permease protein
LLPAPTLPRPRRVRPPVSLTAGALVVGALFTLPLGYLAWEFAQGDTDVAESLRAARTTEAAQRTLVLGVLVAATTAALGTALAWFTTRTDLPLRRMWQVLVPLPLVFPSFVGAIALINAVAPGGLLDSLLSPLGVGTIPRIQGLFGSWFVLTLFTYPLVQLPVAARLRVLPPSLEESARLLGRGSWATFRTVVLPQTRTAISSGSLLVFLYVLSDFGVVQLMRYDTLTRVIYENRLFRPGVAQAAALIVGVLALAVVLAERQIQRRAAVEVRRGRAPHQVSLGRWRWPAAVALAVVMLNALVGPLLSLGYWVWRALRHDADAWGTLGGWVDGLTTPAVNTAAVGLVTAGLAVLLVLPVAYLTARHRTMAGRVSDALVTGGFALPGIAIALALVFWTLRVDVVAPLYQTMVILVLAYIIHFGAQAMRAAQVSVGGLARSLDDAGRLLGAGRLRRLVTIDLPLMRGGLVAGAGLVLLSVMKELPATLLLAPIGFRTLATEIWSAQEFNSFARMGVASIMLVAVSGLLTWVLVVRRADALD